MSTIAGKSVGPTGFGLLGFTQPRESNVTATEALEVMHVAAETGALLWNGGEFYGSKERNTLHLLRDYFTKYPEDTGKIVVVMKGGIDPDKMIPDGTEAGVRRSVEQCVKVLGDTKIIDVFECSRVDPLVPIEETMKCLKALKDEGKIKNIGLSEPKAETIRRAARVVPIATVEAELSLWSRDILNNGVAATCAELGIPIIAYSPLSRGMLSPSIGAARKNSDLPSHLRTLYPRLADGALQSNIRITEAVQGLASRKGCTMTQIALGWIRTLSGKNGLPIIIPIPGAEKEEWVRQNTEPIFLGEDEMTELENIVVQVGVVGDRYIPAIHAYSEG